MSAETLAGIRNAIQAHLTDRQEDGTEPVLGAWFIAYSGMKADTDADDGIAHVHGYATSETDPFGPLGIARIGIRNLEDDLLNDEGFC